MESMIAKRLNWYLESQNLLTPRQAGFRPLHSTNEQIIQLSQNIKENLNKKENTLAIFIDFQTAYDSVWRNTLLEKLQKMAVQDNMHKWISNFITQTFIATKYKNKISKYKQTHHGLPQGAVLSTTLFNVYINDLPDTIEKSNMKTALYADDLVMWTSTNKKNSSKLQYIGNEALTKLKHWSTANLMTVNTDKTNYQIFTLNHKEPAINLHYNGVPLCKTYETKYLGVTLDTKLTWQKHIANISTLANRRLSLLKRLARKNWGSSQNTLSTTYTTYIQPILTYCSEILITTNCEKLVQTQNQALRLITGAVKTTPIEAMEILTNIPNLKTKIEEQALIQYEKLIRLPNNNWDTYQPTNRLKTQRSYITEVRKIKEQLNIPALKETLILPQNPLLLPPIEHYLNLSEEIKKSDTNRYHESDRPRN